MLVIMEERLRQSLLYDFYGELLTDHQKSVFSAAIFDDMSYSELAEEFDCSRQAAFDLIRRINKKLEGYEERLGLLERFTVAQGKMKELKESLLDIHDEFVPTWCFYYLTLAGQMELIKVNAITGEITIDKEETS